MPHKHRRRDKDESNFDLPPTTIAKSLPVLEFKNKDDRKSKNKKDISPNHPTPHGGPTKRRSASRPLSKLEDDTPRAFARLMAFQKMGKKFRSGLDDGSPFVAYAAKNGDLVGQKRKRGASGLEMGGLSGKKSKESAAGTSQPLLNILPGEKLSDFAARVDREMPVSGLKRSQKSTANSLLGLPKVREERITKHEKRLRRLQQQWREEECRIRDREEAEREENEVTHEEQLDLWKEWDREAGRVKSKSKISTRKKMKGSHGVNGEIHGHVSDDDNDDPWAKLNLKSRQSRPLNPMGIAQAPPELIKPREVFKLKAGARVDVANVPAIAGSLRRREELAEERKSFLESYRKIMTAKKL